MTYGWHSVMKTLRNPPQVCGQDINLCKDKIAILFFYQYQVFTSIYHFVSVKSFWSNGKLMYRCLDLTFLNIKLHSLLILYLQRYINLTSISLDRLYLLNSLAEMNKSPLWLPFSSLHFSFWVFFPIPPVFDNIERNDHIKVGWRESSALRVISSWQTVTDSSPFKEFGDFLRQCPGSSALSPSLPGYCCRMKHQNWFCCLKPFFFHFPSLPL